MNNIVSNLNYLAAMLLFSMGLWMVAVQRNAIKKLIGLNIMETSVFLFLVSIGYLSEGIAPIMTPGGDVSRMVNPIPQALILTGIVVAVSTTALALALVVKLYQHYGTLDVDKFREDK
ncbi:MAG: cation:proton antiporter subunit C [Chloroflexota bacterium]